ncbi:type II toxin-antitoxin system PemK/MazF family toxin [Actinoplanes sp. NPDC051859]|uniref:type II toxin-antitoxin system PemK/MazF family toxin n=1 Tax=Actinoplanes sp. NPDC051859 TaxID=3363909 RepID=UPI00379AC19E
MTRLLKSIAGTLRRVVGRSAPAQRTAAPAQRPAPVRPVPTARGGRSLEYSPRLDGDADPGEIVWTWVTYEDDPTQGKDRPVLVVGRDGRTLLGLMLSSQSDRDGQRHWLGLGPGSWDRESRPSWIRLDRVLEVDETGIRREGAVLDRARFERIAAVLRRDYGWA